MQELSTSAFLLNKESWYTMSLARARYVVMAQVLPFGGAKEMALRAIQNRRPMPNLGLPVKCITGRSREDDMVRREQNDA